MVIEVLDGHLSPIVKPAPVHYSRTATMDLGVKDEIVSGGHDLRQREFLGSMRWYLLSNLCRLLQKRPQMSE